MNSKRLDARRLLFVIALFGIWFAEVQSNEEETTVATTAAVIAAAADSTASIGTETATDENDVETNEVSHGQTVVENDGGTGGGSDGEATATTVVSGSVAAAGGETLTSTGGQSDDTTGPPGSDEAEKSSTESNAGGRQDETTVKVTEAHGSDAPGPEGSTLGAETTDKSISSSEKPTDRPTTAEYTTNVVHSVAKEHAITTAAGSETRAVVIGSTTAPHVEFNNCTQCLQINAKTPSRVVRQIRLSICTDRSKTRYTVKLTLSTEGKSDREQDVLKPSPKKPNCTAWLEKFREKYGQRQTSTPTSTIAPTTTIALTTTIAITPSTALVATTTTKIPVIPIERKRRQADDKPHEIDLNDEASEDAIFDMFKTVGEDLTKDSDENVVDGSTGSKPSPTAASDTAGTPPAILGVSGKPKTPNVFEAHQGLFLTVIIILAVCVVVTVFCCLCMKWRSRGSDKYQDKKLLAMEEAREAPTAVSNPIPDAEMVQDEAPMQERDDPAVTPNGGGQHISKADEDNGWVVPLDELSKAEKEKPEVENTRL